MTPRGFGARLRTADVLALPAPAEPVGDLAKHVVGSMARITLTEQERQLAAHIDAGERISALMDELQATIRDESTTEHDRDRAVQRKAACEAEYHGHVVAAAECLAFVQKLRGYADRQPHFLAAVYDEMKPARKA